MVPQPDPDAGVDMTPEEAKKMLGAFKKGDDNSDNDIEEIVDRLIQLYEMKLEFLLGGDSGVQEEEDEDEEDEEDGRGRALYNLRGRTQWRWGRFRRIGVHRYRLRTLYRNYQGHWRRVRSYWHLWKKKQVVNKARMHFSKPASKYRAFPKK